MADGLVEKVRLWARDMSPDADYLSILSQIEYLSEILFQEYEPTKGPGNTQFLNRLDQWVNSAPLVEDQKRLLELVPHLYFIGSNELDTLYQEAFDSVVARWLIDQRRLTLNDPVLETKVRDCVDETWFCPITDSLQIAKFYHLNGIHGIDLRSDWRTLMEFGQPTAIEDYMRSNRRQYLVLLEDYVGSGTQMVDAVRFAARLPNRFPVLVCPMICGPEGIKKGRKLEEEFDQLRFEPVLTVPSDAVITNASSSNAPEIYVKIKDLIARLYPLVRGTVQTQELYGPYGFRNTGSLLLMYTNCPDNVPPIIHHNSDSWTALFPRSSRL